MRALIGVALALASAGCYDAGYLLEKGALGQLPRLRWSTGAVRRLAASPRWLGGAAAMLAGLAFRFWALTAAPVAVVQPVLVGGTVAVVPLARVLLGEKISRREAGATAALLAGVAAVALGAAAGGAVAGGHQRQAPLIVMVLVAVAVGVALTRTAWSQRSAAADAVVVGLCYGTGAIFEKGVAVVVSQKGLVAGLWSSLLSVDPWLFVVATALGLVMFQVALQRRPVSVLVPATNGLASAWAVLGAVVVFAEPWPASALARAVLACGYVSLVAGLVILHRSPLRAPTANAVGR